MQVKLSSAAATEFHCDEVPQYCLRLATSQAERVPDPRQRSACRVGRITTHTCDLGTRPKLAWDARVGLAFSPHGQMCLLRCHSLPLGPATTVVDIEWLSTHSTSLPPTLWTNIPRKRDCSLKQTHENAFSTGAPVTRRTWPMISFHVSGSTMSYSPIELYSIYWPDGGLSTLRLAAGARGAQHQQRVAVGVGLHRPLPGRRLSTSTAIVVCPSFASGSKRGPYCIGLRLITVWF